MEIKVVKEKDNLFFKRKDLILDVTHEGGPTPKIEDLKKEIADKYKVDVSQVIVGYIMTKRGLNKSTAKIRILKEKPLVVEESPTATEEAREGLEAKEESESKESE